MHKPLTLVIKSTSLPSPVDVAFGQWCPSVAVHCAVFDHSNTIHRVCQLLECVIRHIKVLHTCTAAAWCDSGRQRDLI
jgi:hypothetical protein